MTEPISRQEIANALARLLADGFVRHPDALAEVVVRGEEAFIAAGLKSDACGLGRRDYTRIYRRMAKLARLMGLSSRLH